MDLHLLGFIAYILSITVLTIHYPPVRKWLSFQGSSSELPAISWEEPADTKIHHNPPQKPKPNWASDLAPTRRTVRILPHGKLNIHPALDSRHWSKQPPEDQGSIPRKGKSKATAVKIVEVGLCVHNNLDGFSDTLTICCLTILAIGLLASLFNHQIRRAQHLEISRLLNSKAAQSADTTCKWSQTPTKKIKTRGTQCPRQPNRSDKACLTEGPLSNPVTESLRLRELPSTSTQDASGAS